MFTANYSTFFGELSKNNNRALFHTHKKSYYNAVQAPFINLVKELLSELIDWDASICDDPKKALFRINRDIRFSKDLSPYNTVSKAGFSQGVKKSKLPGYYLGIDAMQVHVGSGLFMIRPPDLKKVRRHIARNLVAFLDIIEKDKFKETYGELKGEKSKRLNNDFIKAAEQSEYHYNKPFYAFSEFPLSNFYGSNRLVDEVISYFKIIRPLNTFLSQAFE